jgi:hypothetical protein
MAISFNSVLWHGISKPLVVTPKPTNGGHLKTGQQKDSQNKNSYSAMKGAPASNCFGGMCEFR